MDSNIQTSLQTKPLSQLDGDNTSHKTDPMEDASETIITAEGEGIHGDDFHNSSSNNNHDNDDDDDFNDDDIAVAAEAAAMALGEAEDHAAAAAIAAAPAPLAPPKSQDCDNNRCSSKPAAVTEPPSCTFSPPSCLVCGQVSVSSSGGPNRPLLHFAPSRYVPIMDNGIESYSKDVHVHLFCGKTAAIAFQKNPYSGQLHNGKTAQWEIVTKAGLKHKHGTGTETNTALNMTRYATLPDEPEHDSKRNSRSRRKPAGASRVYFLTREFEANLTMIKSHAAKGWEINPDATGESTAVADAATLLFSEVVNGMKTIPSLTEEKYPPPKKMKTLPRDTKQPPQQNQPQSPPQQELPQQELQAPQEDEELPELQEQFDHVIPTDTSNEPTSQGLGNLAFHEHITANPGSPMINSSPTTITTTTTGTAGSPPTSPLHNAFSPMFLGNHDTLPDDMTLMNFSSFPTTSIAHSTLDLTHESSLSFLSGGFSDDTRKHPLPGGAAAGETHAPEKDNQDGILSFVQQQQHPFHLPSTMYPFDPNGESIDMDGKVSCGCGGRYRANDGSAIAKLSWRNHTLTKQHQKWLKSEQFGFLQDDGDGETKTPRNDGKKKATIQNEDTSDILPEK
jgi:hypothetical protein